MLELPRQIRLAAGDYFMHGQDRKMRQLGLRGNVCAAVLRLGPGLDPAKLRERLAQSPVLDWLRRVRIVRPLKVLPPCWRAFDGPEPLLYEHTCPPINGDGLFALPPAAIGRDLHAASGPSVAFDLVRHPDGTAHLVLTWNHALLDARGVDFLLSHLNGKSGHAAPGPEDLIHPKQFNRKLSEWWPNAKLAHGSIGWLVKSGSEPLFSLMPPGRTAGSARNHYRLIAFSRDETGRINSRCDQICAGFRRSHFYLAASIRGLHEIAVGRGNRDGAYLAPVPHDTRRRGASGPILSNHLSILFYRIEPRHAGRVSDIVAELARQMTDQIRDRFPECCMAALDLFKPLPLDWYVRRLGKPTGGKFASLCFSHSGEVCPGMTEFLGTPLLDVNHLVPTWRPPGLTILFLSFGGRLSALLSWVDDCLSAEEAGALERKIREALLEEPLTGRQG